jgi:hypothetical protein
MLYKTLTKLWKFSLNYGLTWLSAPLTRLINSIWLKRRRWLYYDVKHSLKSQLIEFTFDLEKFGSLTPELLYNIYWTVKSSTHVSHMYGNMVIILTANYDGSIKSLGGHFNSTPSSTPEEFAMHYLHLTNKDGHGESKTVLANAQILKVKVFPLKI